MVNWSRTSELWSKLFPSKTSLECLLGAGTISNSSLHTATVCTTSTRCPLSAPLSPRTHTRSPAPEKRRPETEPSPSSRVWGEATPSTLPSSFNNRWERKSEQLCNLLLPLHCIASLIFAILSELYTPEANHQLNWNKKNSMHHSGSSWLFYLQLLVDDEDQFLEEDEELSKSESLESLGGSSLGGQDRSQESPACPLPPGGGMSRSLRKSAAFHDRSTLEQQVETMSKSISQPPSWQSQIRRIYTFLESHSSSSQMDIMMSIYFNSRTFHKIIPDSFNRNLESYNNQQNIAFSTFYWF